MDDREGNPATEQEKTPVLGSALGRWFFRGGVALGVLVVLLFLGLRIADEEAPTVTASPEADALAREMMAAAGVDAWNRVGAVAWNFGDRRLHLWDRQRGFASVVWDEYVVLLDLGTRRGIAITDKQEIRDEEKRRRLESQAWIHWCNDSFWLNPIAKLFDEGTVRGLVEVPGGRGLGIRYESGGVTPGDTYVWTVDDQGLPSKWAMWTSILPIGGVEATWEGWTDLGNGARISTLHRTALFDLELSEVAVAPDLGTLLQGQDPFAPLVARMEELRFRVKADRERFAPPSGGPEPVSPEVIGRAILEAAGAPRDADSAPRP